MVNVWFENEKLRLKRKSNVDPWKVYDNFRINHHPRRTVKLIDKNEKASSVKIEYVSENKFNVYEDMDEENLKPILMNAEIILN